LSAPLSYPVPWDLVAGLTSYIARRRRRDIDDFTRRIVARMPPPPVYEGLERLPADPRFVLVANHYQRKGLWILHPACVLTQAIAARYGPHPAPARWLATANWPPLKFGPFTIPSPGDWVLPRVAHALCCYPVSFSGSNPAFTARTIRALLRDLPSLERPLGIFPEGVAGVAGRISDPLPGAGRLLRRLVDSGWPCVPAGIGDDGSRLTIRFGRPMAAPQLAGAGDPAVLCLQAVEDLIARSRRRSALRPGG